MASPKYVHPDVSNEPLTQILSRHRMRIIYLFFCYYPCVYTCWCVSLSCQTLLFQIIQIVHFENVTQRDEMYSISVHTVPEAQVGFFNCPEYSDHAKNFVWPLGKFWDVSQLFLLGKSRDNIIFSALGAPRKSWGTYFHVKLKNN